MSPRLIAIAAVLAALPRRFRGRDLPLHRQGRQALLRLAHSRRMPGQAGRAAKRPGGGRQTHRPRRRREGSASSKKPPTPGGERETEAARDGAAQPGAARHLHQREGHRRRACACARREHQGDAKVEERIAMLRQQQAGYQKELEQYKGKGRARRWAATRSEDRRSRYQRRRRSFLT